MENNEAKKYYKVIESDVEMVGHVITLSHEKICRNGNNMGMLSIVFSAEVTDKDYDYQKIANMYLKLQNQKYLFLLISYLRNYHYLQLLYTHMPPMFL